MPSATPEAAPSALPHGVVLVPAAGVVATLGVVLATGALPVLALAVGTVVVLVGAWRLRADQAVAGTLFVVGVGFGLTTLPHLATTPGYSRWTPLVLLGVGGLYALFLLAKFAVKAAIQLLGRRYADAALVAELWDVGASVASLFYLAWQALSFAERVVRSVAVAVVGPSMVLLNAYMTLATRLSETVVDLSLLFFTTAVVLGFHTLSTWTRAAGLARRWNRSTTDRATVDDSRP
jgi:hypothetical protein